MTMNAASLTPDKWEVGLSSWIIQDGNYGDFKTGQSAEFALEFFPETCRKSEVRSKLARNLGAAKYAIIGEVLYLTPEVWVLDFGICAFQNTTPPPGIDRGDFVATEINLGIDPFFYFEGLHALPQMLPLIYAWKMDSILRRAVSGLKKVNKTDAWSDDDGNAEYILNCTRLNTPPKFESHASNE